MRLVDINFSYNGEQIMIRPNGSIFNLRVGDRYLGYLHYTCVSCRAVPDILAEDLLKAIAKHLERWEEKTAHIHIDTHRRVRDELRVTFRSYSRPGYMW